MSDTSSEIENKLIALNTKLQTQARLHESHAQIARGLAGIVDAVAIAMVTRCGDISCRNCLAHVGEECLILRLSNDVEDYIRRLEHQEAGG